MLKRRFSIEKNRNTATTQYISYFFQDVRVFKYSFIKLTKELCPNLTKLSLLMASKSISPYRRIKVEKDMDLRSLQQGFHNLLELHLVGPLFSEYVRYAVAGANQLKCLTLGVEWPDESYCNVGPESRKDVLGKEYIEELLSVNSLQYTEELHFFAQNRRGSVRYYIYIILILTKFLT